ncbi:MAG: hypothetical protein R3321_11820, partial [Nitrososphaeraceae archaeon]|nr:hypothetical protein [Nitrososphaeraceae archaeon]
STHGDYDKKQVVYLNSEYSNVEGLMHYWYKMKEYRNVIDLWNKLNIHMFSSGYWQEIVDAKEMMEVACKSEKDLLALAYFYLEDLGRVYYFQNDKDGAMWTICESYKISKREQNRSLNGLCEQKIGIGLIEKQSYVEAEYHLVKSLNLLKESKDERYLESRVYFAMLCVKLNKFYKAIKLLELVIKNNDSQQTKTMALLVLASVYFFEGEVQKSNDIFSDLIKKQRKTGGVLALAMAMGGKSKVLQSQNEFKKAAILANSSIKLYKKLGIPTDITSIWSFFIPSKENTYS